MKVDFVDLDFDPRLNSESIPYNTNPDFLGITFDENWNILDLGRLLQPEVMKCLLLFVF